MAYHPQIDNKIFALFFRKRKLSPRSFCAVGAKPWNVDFAERVGPRGRKALGKRHGESTCMTRAERELKAQGPGTKWNKMG